MLILLGESCNQGSLMEDLNGGYFYHDGGRFYKDIIKNYKNITKPVTNSSNLSFIKKNIYSKIQTYSFNKQFVIATQEPNVKGHIIGIKFELEDIYSNDKSKSMADSLTKYDPYYQKIFSRKLNYWIISHKEDSLYGPYSKKEYLLKRKELGISEKLKLNPE